MENKRFNIIVKGRVQGVWYRQSTLEEAQRLGIRGWARNLSNGDVEILAEGQEETLKKLVEWCKKGPPLAIVSEVYVKEEPFTGELPKFYIRRD
ncbi:MAG: acylphosphatase [bacterium]